MVGNGIQGAPPYTGGVKLGVSSTYPAMTSVASYKFFSHYAKTTATSGDNRLMYMRYEMSGAGASGECFRASTQLSAALATARGSQISLNVSATGYVTGLGVGMDAQLYVQGIVPANGTYFAAQAEMYFDESATIAAATTHAILSIKAAGNATAVATCLNAIAFSGTEGTGKMIYNHDSTGAAESNGSIRILVSEDDGVSYSVRYLRYWDAQNS